MSVHHSSFFVVSLDLSSSRGHYGLSHWSCRVERVGGGRRGKPQEIMFVCESYVCRVHSLMLYLLLWYGPHSFVGGEGAGHDQRLSFVERHALVVSKLQEPKDRASITIQHEAEQILLLFPNI